MKNPKVPGTFTPKKYLVPLAPKSARFLGLGLVLGLCLLISAANLSAEEISSQQDSQTLLNEVARIKALKESDPQAYAQLIASKKEKVRQKMQAIHQSGDGDKQYQKFAQYNQSRRKQHLEFAQKNRPEQFREFAGQRMNRLERMKEKNPERFAQVMEKKPELKQRFEDRMAKRAERLSRQPGFDQASSMGPKVGNAPTMGMRHFNEKVEAENRPENAREIRDQFASRRHPQNTNGKRAEHFQPRPMEQNTGTGSLGQPRNETFRRGPGISEKRERFQQQEKNSGGFRQNGRVNEGGGGGGGGAGPQQKRPRRDSGGGGGPRGPR